MARITSVQQAKNTVHCKGGHDIMPGQPYQWLKPRYRGRIIGCPAHPLHWYDGSSAKTAPLHAAIDSSPTDPADVPDWLRELAEQARGIGEEYRDSISNLPDSLQSGSGADALETVASELESWADDMEQKASEADDLQGRIDALDDGDATNDDIRQELKGEEPEGEPGEDGEPSYTEEQIEKARDEARSDLEEQLSGVTDDLPDVPEYGG